MIVAKPYQANNLGLKKFTNIMDAVRYLNNEPYISYDMPTIPLKDLVLLGKIYMEDGSEMEV